MKILTVAFKADSIKGTIRYNSYINLICEVEIPAVEVTKAICQGRPVGTRIRTVKNLVSKFDLINSTFGNSEQSTFNIEKDWAPVVSTLKYGVLKEKLKVLPHNEVLTKMFFIIRKVGQLSDEQAKNCL